MTASGSKNQKTGGTPPNKNKASEQSPAPIAESPLLLCGFFPDVFLFFAILVADEGFRIQKLEKTSVRHQKKTKAVKKILGYEHQVATS